ncbi:MAG TPA: glycosyltransferase family 4 protein, partial [Tepidisphaeraceae bacterium]|nr:glycosyltransferase family 4 protein [Tepidisphaeraceae bacterium]
PADRLATLFNAVDLKKFDPDARPETRDAVRGRFGVVADDVMALMIAQDFARKGLAVAIEAIAKCADPRLKLVVVGRDDPSSYQRQAEAVGVANQVVFAGATDDPYSFYRAADLFVLPTRHDPCSLVVLESLAMGLPVISTRFNGASEIMESGKHGFVLENPGDSDALAAAMKSLSGAKPRSEMGNACRELRSRLSYDFHVDQLLKFYRATASPA